MEVILREHVDNLGERGDIVKVANGYGRNYLLPRKLALPVTKGSKQHVERERHIVEARETEQKSQAETAASNLAAVEIVLVLNDKGFEIDKRKLVLPEPLKTLGEHAIRLRLHREVDVSLKVQINKEEI